MTFAEAAIEVLYRAERPLHYKKITEAAIQEELLSHVGRTPAETMEDRLKKEAQKKNGAPVENVRPGVFKLREEYEKKLEDNGRERKPLGQNKPKKKRSKNKGNKKNGKQRRRRRSRSKNKRKSKRNDKKNGRKKRSRKRRRDNKKKDKKRNKKNGRRKRSRGRKSNKKKRNKRNKRNKKKRSKGRSKSRSKRKPSKPARHLDEGPVRMDAIAEAAHTVLDENNRRPMDIDKLAKEIFDRKLVKFHTHDASATVQAAIAGDNQLRKRWGHRPLFIQYDRDRWGLTKWGLSESSVEREQSILSLAEEIRQDAIETLGDALTDVKPEAVEHLALTLLERLGYQDIKVSKRSSEGDVFFTSDWRQGLADVRVCIQVVGDTDQTLSEDYVTELRGTLHHYSAQEGVIIHLGDIDREAVEESREEKLAPITLIDRDTFVGLLIKHGLGVRKYQAPVTMVDTAFLDALASA